MESTVMRDFFFFLIEKIRFLPLKLKQIAEKAIQRNGFFAHSKNILLAMFNDIENLSDEAISKTLKIR